VAGTSDQVDITVKVKEKATGNILLGVGFSSSDGFILQGSISQSNIFGSGKFLGIAANSSKVNRNLGITFLDPYLTIDGVSGGFSLYDRRFDARQLSIGNYVTETLGASVQAGYPVTELDRINLALALEQTSIDVFDNSPQRFIDFVNTNGSDPVALITTLSWSRDRRDSGLFPTSGTFQRLFGEVALPGFDLQYYKIGYQLTWYFPLTRDIITAVNGTLGYGGGYSGGQLPFFKAYYAGGPTTVRGYEQSSLGPRDANGVLGGSRQAILNTEVTFPFPGAGQDRSLRLGWFVDAGQVWADQPGAKLGDIGPFGDLALRYSTGGIFAWNSPFGPLRMYYAFPLNDKPGDQLQKFQFVFGKTF